MEIERANSSLRDVMAAVVQDCAALGKGAAISPDLLSLKIYFASLAEAPKACAYKKSF